MTRDITRRRLLRSTFKGAAVSLSMPLLDILLNDNGKAFADTGLEIPVRFGTWHWGCGMNPDRWVPESTGANWEMTPELEVLAAYRQHFSLFSGYTAPLDGRANEPHISAVWSLRTGYAPTNKEDLPDPSFDALIARAVGGGVRFRSLDMAATGGHTDSYSSAGAGAVAVPELTPLSLYTRLFGPGFRDPNSATFEPGPDIILRHSVLSAFGDERAALMRQVGAADRQKLDAYFTSVREMENQLALQLKEPAPALACTVPSGAPAESRPSTDIEVVTESHKLMVDLTVMALLCHQTKVFNMVFSPSASTLRKPGSADTHHILTHQEAVDANLGYQPESTWFAQKSLEGFAYLMKQLAAAKEGDSTLLDNTLVYAHSDTSFAKMHSLDELPVIIAGRAGGRFKTGLHIREEGAPVTKTALTAMHAMNVRAGSFGKGSLEVSQSISDVLA
ncbi:DUF1552 domain-containing protein [Zhongshania sp.]|uniref:DUF1552 domain-containing protein n=1 Tax=Zhongshania sp. TaxID=1971902 RepID=UPI003564BD4B